MANWNRKTRRQMSKFGIGKEMLDEEIDKVRIAVAEHTSRQAFAAMMLALHEHFDFPSDKLQELAIETMKNVNGGLCATELVERVKEKTGFDVDNPMEEYQANTWEDMTFEDL